MVDASTLLYTSMGVGIFLFLVGYTIGRVGISELEQDVANIKGILSGQEKVAFGTGGITFVPATSTVVVPTNSATTQAGTN